MKFEGTFQYMGNHGIVFNVSQITLTDSERGRLRELHFGEAKSAHYEVNSKVVETYDRMLAKGLPCVMKIGISKPLTRQQGDTLNAQRTKVANLAASAFAAAASSVASPYVGVPVGAGVRAYANDVLPTYHAGDVLVSIEAQVNGGIGPQHSTSTLIIKT
ncbi:hypothetical protein ACVWY1_004528 [Pseudomonas sp. TE6288]|jgi:hypothetical protein|uniref:Uncharacterized protein n=3 Tax=Pseudomonas TaxID=286 RepID=A0A2V4IQC1_9PSED|nr:MULTISPECIES: hypothetical protein [Pseudomonas]ATB66661.1 hypothetical protein CLJ08_19300 [Pseudomonas mosselii]MBH3311274.1 hypothetical protein [Pseudomonas mosselii]MBH3324335.1 hypothetical protein [Pseudomonas mosselii]MBI6953888.1 hypothetical protein [Pseudomonas sp. CCOS 191]MCL8301184.1 hypothetical protein [Pseudomonas mosselii]